MSELEFDERTGIGYYPVENARYDQAYFDKYVAYNKLPFGIALNSLRAGLVQRYLDRQRLLVDIGACDGAFIRARGGHLTHGYDINPVSAGMLIADRCWFDITHGQLIGSASFWDSLEHIRHPDRMIKRIQDYCFVSIPIFRDREHILKSKHFRPTEHYWYFTRVGLIQYFWNLGFVCLEMNDMETQLGREDIGTFVFQTRT